MSSALTTTHSTKDGDSTRDELASGLTLMLATAPKSLLTYDQEVRLAIKIQDGCLESQKELVQRNLRLVTSVAKKFIAKGSQYGLELGDLVQEGCIGLIRAAEKFDPDSGNRFSTYAVWWVMKSINRSISNSGMIRAPANVQGQIKSIFSYIETCRQTLALEPSYEEIALATGISTDNVRLYMNQALGVRSLDAQLGNSNDSTQTLGDIVADNSAIDLFEMVTDAERREAILQAIYRLHDTESEILLARMGLESGMPLSVEECAQQFKIGRQKVVWLEGMARKKLRHDRELVKKIIS